MRCYRLVVLGFALAAAIGLATQTPAQQFPASRIHLIVPSPPGTPPDTVARIVASEITDSEGWQLVVENKPGAIATIGLNEILKRPADGYTLGSIALSSTAAPALIPNIGFRLEIDFAPVVKLASAYHILVVNPSVPAGSLSEFVALLKREPDKMTFSSGGFGTPLLTTLHTVPTARNHIRAPNSVYFSMSYDFTSRRFRPRLNTVVGVVGCLFYSAWG